MWCRNLSSFSAAAIKAARPPQSTTLAWYTTIRTGLNTSKVVSPPSPQGSGNRPPKTTTPQSNATIHKSTKKTYPGPRKPPPKASSQTAIDRYFARFPKFPYDRTRPAANQFTLLRRAENFWGSEKEEPSEQEKPVRRRLSEQERKERHLFNNAFAAEFTAKFGYLGERERYGYKERGRNGHKEREEERQKWMHLAQVLGFDPIPRRVEEFKESMSRIWVNIFDVLQAEKTGEDVERFAGLEELKEYSSSNDKIFPLGDAQGALRFLLKRLSSFS